MSPWVYAIGMVLGGLFFYWLRCTWRKLYGLLEVLFSFVIVWIAFFPHGIRGIDAPVTPPPLDYIILSPLVVFLGAVYVFIRGCDNIDL